MENNLDKSLQKLRNNEITSEQYGILARDVNNRIRELKDSERK